MKKSTWTAILAVSVWSQVVLGADLKVRSRSVEEVPQAQLFATYWARAHRVIPLVDGSRLMLHAEPVGWEKSAITANLFGAGFEWKKTWLAVNLFQPDSGNTIAAPAAQSAGQIYGATLFPDLDTLALSIGWADTLGISHNAIAVTSLTKGQRNLVDFEGTIRDLASGPGSSLIAITYIPGRALPGRGLPLLTLLDTRGHVYGEFFPFPIGADARSMMDTVHRSRLERLGPSRFALFREPEQTVTIFSVTVPSDVETRSSLPSMHLEMKGPWPVKPSYYERPEASVSIERVIPVSDPEASNASRPPLVHAFHVSADESVTVVRTYGDRPHTTVRRYSPNGTDAGSWSPSSSWRAAFWEGERLTGVANQEDNTVLESVTFE